MNMYRSLASDSCRELRDRRYSTRQAVDFDVVLITPLGDVHPATIRDVSPRGFRIRSEYGVTIGRFLALDIPGLPQYSGWVAWSYLGEFGLEAATPIPDQVVDYIIARAGRSGEATDPAPARDGSIGLRADFWTEAAGAFGSLTGIQRRDD